MLPLSFSTLIFESFVLGFPMAQCLPYTINEPTYKTSQLNNCQFPNIEADISGHLLPLVKVGFESLGNSQMLCPCN